MIHICSGGNLKGSATDSW